MADWQTEARRTAQRVGVDPDLYVALVRQESGGNQGAVSPSGAIGYSQLMPGTAKSLGVNPNDPAQNLYGGALYLKQQLKAFGGNVKYALAAYNAGPGAVQKYGGIPPYAQTQNYVKSILAHVGSGSSTSNEAAGAPAASPAAALSGGGQDPGQSADASALIGLLSSQRRQPAAAGPANLPTPAAVAGPALPQAYRALSSGQAPTPKQDISPLLAAVQTPGQAAANVAAQASPLVADASSGPTSSPSTGKGGAQAALGWAESKEGFKETGTNSGGLASYLNSRFGMSNQPWCAMFTSAAVTKGGAPASARTASVQEVRRQAEQGGGGYQKGFIPISSAQPGDLILFGNDHIGMVKAVSKGKVTYVGGNQSNGVNEATTTSGDIVRPRYGARK